MMKRRKVCGPRVAEATLLSAPETLPTPVLPKAKHEHFAQSVAKGLSAAEAYISAGYSKAGAAQNASRLITKDQVSARIEELRRTISDGVIQLAIRERSARVQILQDNLDRLRNVIRARAFEYAHHLGGATGMLVRDYRGKNAEREIYRFDSALVAQINDTLKQAAIEEGQWTEKRETAGTNINVLMDLINDGRTRVADEQEAREAAEAQKP